MERGRPRPHVRYRTYAAYGRCGRIHAGEDARAPYYGLTFALKSAMNAASLPSAIAARRRAIRNW